MGETGRRWTLARRPDGAPRASDFALEPFDLPQPGAGEILVAVSHHTVAPGVRARLAADTYAARVEIGEPIPGNGVGRVVASGDPRFVVGDRVSGELGWASHMLVPAGAVQPLDPQVFRDGVPDEAAVGILGSSGLTAYFGLLDIAAAQPGEAVIVSSAAGAVGSAVGQVARIRGLRVIGIAGSAEKCADLVARLGFDAAVDYHEADLAAAIGRAAPEGAHIYFDNVGGRIADAAILNLAVGGRIALCGQTADYNAAAPRGLSTMVQLISRRITMRGFIVHDFADRFAKARREMAEWLRDGRLISAPTILDGLERAAEAFAGQFDGTGQARPLIRV